jgi:hypothetical protein
MTKNNFLLGLRLGKFTISFIVSQTKAKNENA